MSDFVFDALRHRRIGLPEAILCQGKTPEQVAAIARQALTHHEAVLLTRLSEESRRALPPELGPWADQDPVARTAILGQWRAPQGAAAVALISAGTSDLPVLREAERTLAFAGVKGTLFADIGVAGLWRLLERLEEIRGYRVVIACAGMDGALFSVLGGLIPGLIIALPTSTGYGMALSGQTALQAALASCAPGIVAVNIDNGYGAACAALRLLTGVTP